MGSDIIIHLQIEYEKFLYQNSAIDLVDQLNQLSKAPQPSIKIVKCNQIYEEYQAPMVLGDDLRS